MRQFIAACCCAIVGLEVLIAVPLVTCLVVLGVIGGVDVNQVATDGPQYSALPMAPPPMLNSAAFDGPTIGPPPPSGAPTICVNPPSWPVPQIPSAPEVCQAPSVATVPAAVGPQVEAIAEVLDQVGSPLAASSLAGDSQTTRSESIAALNRVAQEDTTPLETSSELTRPTKSIAALKPGPEPAVQEPAPAGDAVAGPCPKTTSITCPENRPAKPALVDSLQVTAELLYARAQALEVDGNFDRADHLRGLARDIRREIDTLRDESNGASPVPATVTAASFNSQLVEEPAKLDANHAAPSARPLSTSPSPLLPARAKLVEHSPNPSPITFVRPTIVIEEEAETLLPEAQKDPLNPVP